MRHTEYPNNKNFLFYGTLRSGQGNWRWAVEPQQNAECKGTHVLKGYKLYGLNAGYPWAVKTGNEEDTIVVELFKLTDETKCRQIHGMEIGAGYSVEKETIDGEEYSIYVHPTAGSYAKEIPHGDWVKHRNERLKAVSN